MLDWKLVDEEGVLRLRCERRLSQRVRGASGGSRAAPRRRVWRVKDAAAGQELVARITSLATAEGAREQCRSSAHALAANGTRAHAGHTASGQVAGGEVTMELMTPALRGLSENDFIVAAKADALSLADLVVAKKKTTFYF